MASEETKNQNQEQEAPRKVELKEECDNVLPFAGGMAVGAALVAGAYYLSKLFWGGDDD